MIIEQNKIKPEGARVLIEPFLMEDETDNGMILSNTQSSSAPVMGKIIRAGKKSRYQKDQVVFFARYSADLLEIDTVDGKTKIYIVVDEEILASVDGEKNIPKYPKISEKKLVESLSKGKK